MRLVRKYGLFSVLVPALLPPPAPFKLFVLAAGIARIRVVDFVVAVSIGRGIRYFGEGLLALWYGERGGRLPAREHPRRQPVDGADGPDRWAALAPGQARAPFARPRRGRAGCPPVIDAIGGSHL